MRSGASPPGTRQSAGVGEPVYPRNQLSVGSGSQSPSGVSCLQAWEPVPQEPAVCGVRGQSPRNWLSVGLGSQSPQEQRLSVWGQGASSPQGTLTVCRVRGAVTPGTGLSVGSGSQSPGAVVCGVWEPVPQEPAVCGWEPVTPGAGCLQGRGASHPTNPVVCGGLGASPRNQLSAGLGSQSPQEPTVCGSREPVPRVVSAGLGSQSPRNWLSAQSGASPQEPTVCGVGEASHPRNPAGLCGVREPVPANAERQALLIYGLSLDCRLPEGQVCAAQNLHQAHLIHPH